MGARPPLITHTDVTDKIEENFWDVMDIPFVSNGRNLILKKESYLADTRKTDNYKLVCKAITNVCLMDDITTIEEQAEVCIILGRIKNKLQSN